MTILEFVQQFPGFRFKLEFKHLNADGTTELDPEYCYYGSTDDFERKMAGYDWIFDYDLVDREVVALKVNKRIRLVEICFELEH